MAKVLRDDPDVDEESQPKSTRRKGKPIDAAAKATGFLAGLSEALAKAKP